MFLPGVQTPALGTGMWLGGRALPRLAPNTAKTKKQSLQYKGQIAKHSSGKQTQEDLGELKISLDYI